MRPVCSRSWLAVSLLLSLVCSGCSTTRATRVYKEPPPADIKPTVIDYVDSDGFDTLLESALINQDPAIIIQTENQKPDWDGRLNAWIAAWNLGGKVEDGQVKRRFRFQAPLPSVDGDSIREFRKLVESLMDRVEDLATRGAAWWREEKTRSRRIALLKPYNLRFHLDDNQNIQIILFNGMYSRFHKDWVQSIASSDAENADDWVRAFSCSRCKENASASDTGTSDGYRLTSRSARE